MIERSAKDSLSPSTLYKQDKALERISETLIVGHFRDVVTIYMGHNRNKDIIFKIWKTNKRC